MADVELAEGACSLRTTMHQTSGASVAVPPRFCFKITPFGAKWKIFALFLWKNLHK